MSILVIEDDPVSRKLALRVLEHEGFHVMDADSAEKAFEVIRESRPGIILLDLSLPDMDGLALALLLKGDLVTKTIPIIAVTSFPDRFPREQALKAGCDAYLVKPIDTRALPGIISTMHRSESKDPGS